MRKEGSPITLSVPLHPEIKKGLLRSLIKDAGIDLEDFLNYLILWDDKAIAASFDALKRHQAESAAELDGLMPSILDRAFRGEL